MRPSKATYGALCSDGMGGGVLCDVPFLDDHVRGDEGCFDEACHLLLRITKLLEGVRPTKGVQCDPRGRGGDIVDTVHLLGHHAEKVHLRRCLKGGVVCDVPFGASEGAKVAKDDVAAFSYVVRARRRDWWCVEWVAAVPAPQLGALAPLIW